MAETTGLVHRLKIDAASGACWLHIGPSSTDAALLCVSLSLGTVRGELAAPCMVNALTSALIAGHEVTVSHGADDPWVYHFETKGS